MEIGFIGTGLMGLPMAQRVMDASFPLIVYNRTPEKLETLREAGAAIAPNPETLIQASSCIVLMLTNTDAIRSILLSDPCRSQLAGKTILQMSTIAPSESRTLHQEILALGGDYLEAPVLGSIPEATSGKLMVMVGGTPEQFEQWQDVLRCFGPQPLLIGTVGTAAAVKLALNQLIGSLTAAFSTSLAFVQQQGADVEQFMQILRGSALYAPTFDKKLQRMLDRDYANPNFPTKHMHKDITLFLGEAAGLDLNPQIPAAVQQILQAAIERGLAETDYSAMFSAVEHREKEEG